MNTQDNISPQSDSKSIDLQNIINMDGIHWSGPHYQELMQHIIQFLSDCMEKNIMPLIQVLDFFNLFKSVSSLDLSMIKFESLTEEQKMLISMIYASDLYIVFSSNSPGSRLYREWGLIIHSGITDKERDMEEDRFSYLESRYHIQDQPTPPLKKVFLYLTQAKKCYCFILEWFYRYLESNMRFSFDYKIYNNLYESITEEDFERFRGIIYSLKNDDIHNLSISVEKIFPIVLFMESNLNEGNDFLSIIREEIFSQSSPKREINISLITLIFTFIVFYIFTKNVYIHLPQDTLNTALSPFRCFISNRFIGNYMYWIIMEIEMMSTYFRKYPLFNFSLGITENTNENVNNDAEIGTGQATELQEPGSNGGNGGQHVDPPKQHESNDRDPKKDHKKIPGFIKVPCGQRMLDKLINGLINGHKDDTLGGFIPLVSSKTGEDKESIKKKLICLFTGEGINDESIKWPYNLKWNDYANSLKLLVYLLHYEGIIIDPLDEKEGAIDKKDVEGINQKIRTEFRGKNVWAIVGTALGYGKNTLRNKIKIPKQSNLSLMKKLAQFWFECKKLDD